MILPEGKVNQLLALLEESRVTLMKMQRTCEHIEKEFREAINSTWPLPPAA